MRNLSYGSGKFRLSLYLAGTAMLLLGLTVATSIQAQTATPANPDSGSASTRSSRQEKRRIAILDFDFSSISSPQWLALFPGIARGTSDILVNQLVNDGTYIVIERSQIQSVLDEQDLGQTGRIDAATAAQIGKILGVDAVIIGSVTQFDLQEKRSGFSLGGLFGESKQQTQADVQLNVRMVSSGTAEILATAEGAGSANQSDSSTQVLGIGGGSETDNRQQLLTAATKQAIEAVATQLTAASTKLTGLPPVLPTSTALVADVSGNTVILNQGTAAGYRQGMRVSIERVAREVKDPATGQVLRQVTEPIGVVELVDVDNVSSLGRVISGSSFKVGDVAKPAQ